MNWLKAHWPAVGAIISAVLPFELPSIKAFIAANPHSMFAVLLGAIVAAYYAQSPLAPKNGQNQQAGKFAPLLILFLLFGNSTMAQTTPPTQPFVLSTSGGTFNGQPVTIASAGVQLTAEKPVAVAVGYQYIFNPSDSTQPHFGGGVTDTTFSLASIVPQAIKSKLLVDLTNYNLTLIAGAGVKSTFNGIGLPRTQHVVGDFGLSPTYPIPGGHVQVAPLYQILLGPHHKTDRVLGGTLNFTF